MKTVGCGHTKFACNANRREEKGEEEEEQAFMSADITLLLSNHFSSPPVYLFNDQMTLLDILPYVFCRLSAPNNINSYISNPRPSKVLLKAVSIASAIIINIS